jgi:hypothetical protein
MEKKFIRLTESDLKKIIKRVISEQGTGYQMNLSYAQQDNTRFAPLPTGQALTLPNPALDQIKKVYPKATASKMGGEPAALVIHPNSEVYYFIQKGGASGINQQRYFQYLKDKDGNVTRTNAKIGNWKIEGNKVKTNPPIETSDNTVQKTPSKQSVQPVGTSKPNTKESAIGVVYQYEYPNDKKYVYGVKDGKWYSKTLVSGKEFDISVFPTSVANLNKQFPGALKGIVEPQGAPKPVAPNPESATPGLVQEPTSGNQAYNPNDVS